MSGFNSEKLKGKAVQAVRTAKNLAWEVKAAPDRTFEFTKLDIEDNKLMSMLSYVSVLVLIPLFAPRFTGKQSAYMTFHVKQGLLLLALELAAALVLGLFSHIPLIGWLFAILKYLVYLCCAALSIKHVLDVLKGRAVRLPFVDKLGIKL